MFIFTDLGRFQSAFTHRPPNGGIRPQQHLHSHVSVTQTYCLFIYTRIRFVVVEHRFFCRTSKQRAAATNMTSRSVAHPPCFGRAEEEIRQVYLVPTEPLFGGKTPCTEHTVILFKQ